MPPDQPQRSIQHPGILGFVEPRRAARGMRKDDDVEGASGAFRAMQLTDSVFQLANADELHRGERPDRDDELRFQ
jgi:hypothetical protein